MSKNPSSRAPNSQKNGGFYITFWSSFLKGANNSEDDCTNVHKFIFALAVWRNVTLQCTSQTSLVGTNMIAVEMQSRMENSYIPCVCIDAGVISGYRRTECHPVQAQRSGPSQSAPIYTSECIFWSLSFCLYTLQSLVLDPGTCICFPTPPSSLGLQVVEGGDLQGEMVALQSSLFCCQLELEASQRAQRQSQRVTEDLAHSRDRLHSDLEAALQHRETTEKYNQVGTNKDRALKTTGNCGQDS